jgi:alpha-tubulin suppressor-like RCC1 family protein
VAPVSGPFLAAGAQHTCAIFAAGALRCWGDDTSGQLGLSPGVDPLNGYSVDLGTGRRAAAVFAGQAHTCAILDDGAVKCWGLNTFGQLGLGDMNDRGDGMTAMGDGLPALDLGTGRRAVALAPGNSATCALFDDGAIKCWGDAYQGALGYGDIETRGATPGTMGDALPMVDLGSRDGVRFKVKSVAAIDYHSFCAILDDTGADNSAMKCWGSNDYCEIGIGSTDGGRGGMPGAMGNNLAWTDIGTTAAGAARKAVALAPMFQSICVLGDDGAVKCWGVASSGELGIGTAGLPRSCSPDEMGNAGLVPLPAPAVAIGARGGSDGRGAHACALLATGQMTCWGENSFGQLGTGDTTELLSPSDPLVFGDGFVPATLVLGNQHTCAISADKRVKCWGSNEQGQLDPTTPGDVYAPGADLRLAGKPVAAVAAGGDHTCAVLGDGTLECWGGNSSGELGLGDTTNRGDQPSQLGDHLPAVDLGGGAHAKAVAAGTAHTCAVLDTGAVECWGAGDAGQLGLGSTASLLAPAAAVALPGAATAVAAGADFSCALLAGGQIICWGAGARGQLGAGDTQDHAAPAAAVGLAAKATALAAGDHHACALLTDGTIACWGAGDRGQLGAGDTQDRAQPAKVSLGGARALAVAARADTTCALQSGGQVACWGAGDRGQLGLGDAQDRAAPAATTIDLGTGRSATAVAVGGQFACAVLDLAQAKCWGDNREDQLGAVLRGLAYGDGPDETGDFLPAAVQGGGRSVRAVASGRAHTCAILDTSDVRCWGDNSLGQLGAGDADEHSLFLNPSGVVDLGAAAP